MPTHPIIRFKNRVAAAPPGSSLQKRQSRILRKSSMKQLVSQHRLSMQGISYGKAMEFPADGPGRVIVRLERLMGSDRIRITDPRYMATLLQRLTEEEELTWQKRTRERRKTEQHRFRQLVIDGYTEPTPGMEDLYNHPVFRVNRILNRLNRLNNLPIRTNSLPPIIPVDPFQYDESGRVFKSYSGHFVLERPVGRKNIHSSSALSITESSSAALETSRSQTSLNLDKDRISSNQFAEQGGIGDDDEKEVKGEFYSKIGQTKNVIFSSSSSPAISPPKTESKPKGTGAVDKNNSETVVKADVPKVPVINIQQLQRKYGVAQKTNLGIQYNPYRSEIVEPIFNDEERGVWDLYEMGTNIVNLYDRQQQITDDYIASLYEKYNKKKCKGSSSKAKSTKRIFGEVDRGFDDTDDSSSENWDECVDTYDDMPLLTSSTAKSETERPPTWNKMTGLRFGEEEGEGEGDDDWEEHYEMPGEDGEFWNVSDLEYPDDGSFKVDE